MRAIVLSALVGAGVLGFGSAPAQAGGPKKLKWKWHGQAPVCQPVPVARCAPPAPALGVAAGFAGLSGAAVIAERAPVLAPPALPACRPPGVNVAASIRMEVRLQPAFGGGCAPPPPPPCR